MPEDIAIDLDQYALAVSSATWFDLSDHGLVQCQGKDAGRFLHNLCTNDVLKLPANRSCEAFFTTAQGKIVEHAWILNLGPENGLPTFWMDLDSNDAPRFLQHLDRHLISEQVELADLTEVLARAHLVGPVADQILASETESAITQLKDQDSVPHVTTMLHGRMWRRNRLGIAGIDVIYPRTEVDGWRSLRTIPDFPEAGKQVFEWLRVEAGMPKYGVDITENSLPQEVDRTEQAISFTKGCYIGQETVARIHSRGHVNRVLRGLVVEGNDVLPSACKLYQSGQEIGIATSSVISPRLDKVIALATIRRGHEAPGTELIVGEPSSSRKATVAALPFLPFIGRRP